MADWFINCLAAQELYEKHGFTLGIHKSNYIGSIRLNGNYYVDFKRNRLIVHDSFVRTPRLNLSVNHVLELKFLPDDTCREAYLKILKEEYCEQVSH